MRVIGRRDSVALATVMHEKDNFLKTSMQIEYASAHEIDFFLSISDHKHVKYLRYDHPNHSNLYEKMFLCNMRVSIKTQLR